MFAIPSRLPRDEREVERRGDLGAAQVPRHRPSATTRCRNWVRDSRRCDLPHRRVHSSPTSTAILVGDSWNRQAFPDQRRASSSVRPATLADVPAACVVSSNVRACRLACVRDSTQPSSVDACRRVLLGSPFFIDSTGPGQLKC